ncbi:MAG: Bax inhibitor-1/YccA family protein [Alphaproteobacteria bacterium]|nr:Bax inhibitor-1/YccA family protein [Alphaproteobacteria bacterium]
MSFMQERQQAAPQTASVEYDEGLRTYMLRVYNYMAGALGLSGIVAFVTANTPVLFNAIFGTPFFWVVALAPLGIAMYSGAKVQTMSVKAAQTWFWVFAAVMGLSMASIFVIYTGASVARVFFITAGTFGAMSIYGYSTHRDLTGMGSFLIMGAIGIMLASIVNIFLESQPLHMAISVIGVLVFVGLTAYDTQRIKQIYRVLSGDMLEKVAIQGALSLYLDFINLFMMLLRLMGDRR